MDTRNTHHIRHVIHGTSPRIIFLSGTHGDEYESGTLLTRYLADHRETLPPFLHIPEVSPSAVAAKTRKNAYGNDINRQFVDGTTDPEALALMDFLSPLRTSICIDLHEDPDRSQAFYLYDSDTMNRFDLDRYHTAVHQTEARLYTGIDDIEDEHLRLHIDKGYISLPPEGETLTTGFSSIWMIRHGITKRAFTLEIPGKATAALKQSLIAAVIPFLIAEFVPQP